MVTQSESLVTWLRRARERAGADGFVVGLSGGVDSAVVARLCQMAAPGRVLCLLLPCHSNARDAEDAQLVAGRFGLPTITIALDAAYDALTAAAQAAMQTLPAGSSPDGRDVAADRDRLALANVKPRLRMTALYFVANLFNYLVVGSGNRSELAVGYFTKHGDGGVDLLPLGRLVKREVRALARELGVPQSIIDKPPTAGLWPGQTDEGEMGVSYADLDAYLEHGPQAVAPAVAMRIERLARTSEHKRALPPIPDEAP